MDVKPPVMVAIVVAVLVLIVGAFMAYDRRQKAAMNNGPTVSHSQYLPPPSTRPPQ